MSKKTKKKLEKLGVEYYFQKKHPNQDKLYIKKREKIVLPKFRVYDFLDSKNFGGILTDPSLLEKSTIPVSIEEHAKLIMLNFMSFRELKDLTNLEI